MGLIEGFKKTVSLNVSMWTKVFKRVVTVFICFLLLVGNSACSKDDCEDRDKEYIVQTYTASYVSFIDKTYVRIKLSLVHNNVLLAEEVSLSIGGKCGLSHNLAVLSKVETDDSIFYDGTLDGFVSSHEFTFIYGESSYKNSFTINPIDFVDPPATISRSDPQLISFTGEVGDSDTVLFYAGEITPEYIERELEAGFENNFWLPDWNYNFSEAGWNLRFPYWQGSSANQGDGTLSLEGNHVFTKDSLKMFLRRQTVVNSLAEHPGAGGGINAVYTTDFKDVEVED